MTIIAAVKDHAAGTVLMGADRVDHIRGLLNVPMVTSKIFEHRGWVLGVCGLPRIWMLLHEWQPSGNLDVVTLTNELTAVLWHGDNDEFMRDDDGQRIAGGVLFAHGEQIFWLSADLAVIEVAADYWALGAGDEVALGALSATADLAMSAQERLGRALDAAAQWTAPIQPPFDIVSTPSAIASA